MNTDWYKGKNVLVTGGAGFIGSHLAQTLVERGAYVSILDDLSAGTLDNIRSIEQDAQISIADVCNENSVIDILKDSRIIFHLAANASVPYSVENPRNDFQRNAWGTFNILDVARRFDIESIVVASSGAVYGQPNQFPIVESEAIQPISPYGASKGAAESICQAFSASYSLPIKIARIFNTYGPRQPRFVMYDFYRKLRRDPSRLEILGNGKQIRDYCFVADTVEGLLCLGELSLEKCETFNISSGQSYSVIDVATTLADTMGLSQPQIFFTGESWMGDAQKWEVSTEKLTSFTEYRPRYSLVNGLQQFVEWFDQHPERIVS